MFIIVSENHKVLISSLSAFKKDSSIKKIIILYMHMYFIASTNFRTFSCTYTHKPTKHACKFPIGITVQILLFPFFN